MKQAWLSILFFSTTAFTSCEHMYLKYEVDQPMSYAVLDPKGREDLFTVPCKLDGENGMVQRWSSVFEEE